MSEEYNYQVFTPQTYDFMHQSGLQPGDKLPALTLINTSGNKVKLKSLLGKILVLETGSTTCPLYVGKIKTMNAVAAKHKDVNFAVLYIREAHPGSKIPAHPTSDAKMKSAQLLQATEPENRTILVDTLAGKLHENWGFYQIWPMSLPQTEQCFTEPTGISRIELTRCCRRLNPVRLFLMNQPISRLCQLNILCGFFTVLGV